MYMCVCGKLSIILRYSHLVRTYNDNNTYVMSASALVLKILLTSFYLCVDAWARIVRIMHLVCVIHVVQCASSHS